MPSRGNESDNQNTEDSEQTLSSMFFDLFQRPMLAAFLRWYSISSAAFM